jgi:hypothetical protein
MLEDQKTEAQQILDDLFSERLIPFKLTAHKVESVGVGDYIVLFNDSRLYSVDVVWNQGENFKDAFRESLLDLLERRSGRLREKAASKERGQSS